MRYRTSGRFVDKLLEPISELAQEDESTGEVKEAQEVLGLHLGGRPFATPTVWGD